MAAGDLPEYIWTCRTCGEQLRAAGPASLEHIKRMHEYWEHTRQSKEYANGGYIDKPAPTPDSDYVLINGVAALDDAFYDGARLSARDRTFLSVMKVCWSTAAVRL